MEGLRTKGAFEAGVVSRVPPASSLSLAYAPLEMHIEREGEENRSHSGLTETKDSKTLGYSREARAQTAFIFARKAEPAFHALENPLGAIRLARRR